MSVKSLDAKHKAATKLAAAMSSEKRRAEAGELRKHLTAETIEALEKLQPERQMVVLLGLKQQIDTVRLSAEEAYKKLLHAADGIASQQDTSKDERGRLLAVMQASDVAILPDLLSSLGRAIQRQLEMQNQYNSRKVSDQRARLLAIGLTFLVLLFVIWSGVFLSRGDNMYRLITSVYRGWDAVNPTGTRSTLFNEPSANKDEYAYYN